MNLLSAEKVIRSIEVPKHYQKDIFQDISYTRLEKIYTLDNLCELT